MAPDDFHYSFVNLSLPPGGEKTILVSIWDNPRSEGSDETVISSLIGFKRKDIYTQASVPCVAKGFSYLPEPIHKPMMLDQSGRVFVWQTKKPFGLKPEIIDSSENGPQHIGPLEEIRVIDNEAYVVGSGRVVYKHIKNGKWEAIDKGIRSINDDVAGFFSIDGFTHDELYAAGYDGELFRYDGTQWRQITLPTNMILYRVLCAPDGKTYVSGQNGILFVGRGDDWLEIEHNSFNHTIWGSTWFKGSTYFSTSHGVFKLVDKTLEPVPILLRNGKEAETKRGISFYRIDADEHSLWSVGPKMAVWTEDGDVWEEVSYK